MSRITKFRLALFIFMTAFGYIGNHSFLESLGWGALTVLFSFGDWQPGGGSSHSFNNSHNPTNPASGLPMAGGVDIRGNTYGTNDHI